MQVTPLSCGKTPNAEKVCADCTTGNVETSVTTVLPGVGSDVEPDALKSCHYKTTRTIDVDADGVYTCTSSPIPPPCYTCLSTEQGHAHTVTLLSPCAKCGKPEQHAHMDEESVESSNETGCEQFHDTQCHKGSGETDLEQSRDMITDLEKCSTKCAITDDVTVVDESPMSSTGDKAELCCDPTTQNLKSAVDSDHRLGVLSDCPWCGWSTFLLLGVVKE